MRSCVTTLSAQLLWVSEDGSRAQWLHATTDGVVPAHCYHHTANVFDQGRRMVLFGGEGYWLQDR